MKVDCKDLQYVLWALDSQQGDVKYNWIADLNDDRIVNQIDLSIMKDNLGNLDCEVDTDGDGVPDGIDTCPALWTPNQANYDGDSLGNACDRCPHDSTNTCLSYSFTGFLQPVVKFSLDGNQGFDIFAAGYPSTKGIACDTVSLADDIEQTVTAGGSALTYDATADQYSYVWKTNTAWKGTCRQLIVRLKDGTDHVANFRFK
jgi:hypothetical protein